MNRFKDFNDDELYILKRSLIEATKVVMYDDFYTKEEVSMMGVLLDEVIDSINIRDAQKLASKTS